MLKEATVMSPFKTSKLDTFLPKMQKVGIPDAPQSTEHYKMKFSTNKHKD